MPETPNKQYVGPEALVRLVAHLRSGWSRVGHEHNLEDITDYVVDDTLSSSSINPVQNKVVNLALSENLDAAKIYTDGEIGKLTSGSTPVKEAERADNATMAEEAKVAQLANQATEAVKATKDGQDRDIVNTYETKTDAVAKLNEAKTYADNVKDDLLNGAGPAYDTLKELGELINDNQDAIAVLNEVAVGKADKEHTHTVSDITDMPEIANADWNENNPESAAYINNRPHWVEFVETSLLEETNVEIAEGNNYAQILTSLAFEDGETYIVTFDGTSYECVAENFGGTIVVESEQFTLASDGSGCGILASAGTHTISITGMIPEVCMIDKKYLPQGISIGKTGTATGAEIFNFYEGSYGPDEDAPNEASGKYSHSEGKSTIARGTCSHAEGSYTEANGSYSHAEGYGTEASGSYSHAEGSHTVANVNYSHAEGFYTIASSESQHVQGRYNIEDTSNTYAHIVGNGGYDERSNAHTLDWDGNAWYAGTIKVGGTSYADATELLTNTPSSLVNLGMPATATIGQTAIVKTIDENGMPIEWEAADLGNITIDEDGNAWFGTAEEIYKIPEGLPDYTNDDEGKVLSVVDGMAAWTENKGGSSSGGGGIVVSETEPTDESVIFWVQI